MFILKWFKNKNHSKRKKISKKKSELVQELNEHALLLLRKKEELELSLLESLKNELKQEEFNKFKNKIDELRSLSLRKKIQESQLFNEINYLENVLNEKFDELNKKEIKLCAYFRLGFSTKEISAIEHIDLNEIRLYKTAIRRKLNLNDVVSLKDYLVFEE